MNRLPLATRPWVLRTERGALRLGMITLGFGLTIIGLGLGVSIIMLPPGIIIGLCGVGLVVWGAVGELPID
jgi:hypothetical protein